MAIVKQNVCTFTTVYFYRTNAYPSEPTFIDDPNSEVEDHGVLVFTLLDGLNETSSYFVVDPLTMTELAAVNVGSTIGFTTHGKFYSNTIY
jgi:carotenoid cleavage dioxygenase-like enzyme